MQRYVAFLRGVNVGGRNLVDMKELCKRLESAGFKNVSSYKASGNILFESSRLGEEVITRAICKHVSEMIGGKEVEIFLRSHEELRNTVNLDPFNGRSSNDRTKKYVSFMSDSPEEIPASSLPLFSSRKDVEVIFIEEKDAFSFSHLIDGKFGFPNAFVEKKFGVFSTTRDWNTVLGITKLLNESELHHSC